MAAFDTIKRKFMAEEAEKSAIKKLPRKSKPKIVPMGNLRSNLKLKMLQEANKMPPKLRTKLDTLFHIGSGMAIGLILGLLLG